MSEENNDIEDFFSSRLSKGDIPFEEGDWNAMEDKLDEFDALARSSGLSRGYIAGLSLIGVLLFLSGWYGHQWIVDKSNPNLSSNDISLNSPGKWKKDINTEDLPIIDSIKLKKDLNNEVKSGNITGVTKENPETLASSMNQETELSSSGKSTSANQVLNNMKPDLTRGSDSYVNGGNLNANTGKKKEYGAYSTRTKGNTLTLMRLSSIKPDWTPQLPEFDLFSSPIPDYERSEIQGLKKFDKEEDIQRTRGWSLGITFAPDMNAVGSASNYRLAWEGGLTGTYDIARKWRISTGVLYAKKAYNANGTDYDPPEGYWDYTTNGIVPDDVAARCGIIDVPLNLTFIWNPESRVHFTTTTGLSNYFILNEDYEYSFGYQYPSTGYSGWSTQENSIAFFGMLNVAVGVEWEMHNTWFVSMEPYFKVPLKEIGFGSVPLRGTGVFFSIRKQLNRK